MYSDFDEVGPSYVRAPVRGFTYYPPVGIFESAAGQNNNNVSIKDFAPIVSSDLFAIINKRAIPGDLTPENSKYLTKTDASDAILDASGRVVDSNNIPQVSPNDFRQVVNPPNGIIADEWFILAPTIGVGGIVGTLLDLALSFQNTVTTEDLTLGVIGNVDKVNQYDIDLQYGFGTYPFGVGVDNICVQVFPLATPSEFVTANTFLGSLSLAFGSHARVNRALACSYFVNSDCLKQDSINYIYSLSGFDKAGPDKKLSFSATWAKKTVEKSILAGKVPLMLVRVLSAKPESPFKNEGTGASISFPTYVSPATTVPSSKVVYTSLVRCDRSYIAFDQRWPQDIFNAMARISSNAGMDTFKQEMAKCIQLFAGTMRVMKHHDIFTALTVNAPAGIIGVPFTLAAGLAISTVATSVKTIGILGSGILDSAEGIWNVAINLPVISFAVDTLNSLGFDLVDIFQDSYIQRGDSPVIINLLRTAVYSQGER
jgi:hypothetical protein